MIWQNTTNQTILIVEMDVKSKKKAIYIQLKIIWKSKEKRPSHVLLRRPGLLAFKQDER